MLLLGLHSLLLLGANNSEHWIDFNPKHEEDKDVVSFIYHRFGDDRHGQAHSSGYSGG